MRSAGDEVAVGTHAHVARSESLAERLEREYEERQRAELERRARMEQAREARERAVRQRRERRRHEWERKLDRERELLRSGYPRHRPEPGDPAARTHSTRILPGVEGPVRRRTRAAENRRLAAIRTRGLFWPTAKAGFAVTLILGVSAGVGSLIGIPVPELNSGAGGASLASSATLFGVDPGTPPGLASGYVFPIIGPHDFGDSIARFGAPRSGHMHEGQDIFAKAGRPEVAVHDGVVVDRGKVSDPDSGGRGNYVVIYDPADDHSFVYMHMEKPSPVGLGQQVHAGEVVGQVGCTGECDGNHLHFEVRIGKASKGADTKPVDPLPYLRQWPQATPG
jgi:murein DD-endopeptidase MepM/ murein hydrolase activator NlpD